MRNDQVRVYRLTLANGATFEIVSKCPRPYWKSDLMRLAPFGTVYVGASFAVEYR